MNPDAYAPRKARSDEMLKAGVEPVKDGFSAFYVPSQSTHGRKYKVTITKGWYACECADNQEGNLCKHILFLKTWFALKFKAQDQKAQIVVSHPCPRCSSTNLQKDGTRKTAFGKKQKWHCLDCGSRFVNEPVSKIKGNLDTVITAIDLYMKGVSYRGIADSLKQLYGLKVTHPTVMAWVQTYMAKINTYAQQQHPVVGETWHADEQFIKVQGKQEYVWNVLDGDTRFLLAANHSPTRRYEDARTTFQIAKETAQKKAQTVVTDGSFNYTHAVHKEFATYANPQPHKRYVSIRAHDSSNNNIERFHGTFRQRDKVMKGFQANQHQHAQNFQTYYNFIKPHEGLQGQTPAQKAGLKTPQNWKALLLAALEQPRATSRPLPVMD